MLLNGLSKMKTSKDEKRDVLELRDKIKRSLLSGSDVKSQEPDYEYLSLCYEISLLCYPDVLLPLGLVLYTECSLFLQEGISKIPQGYGDAVVYWILSDLKDCADHGNSVLKKFSSEHLEIIFLWLKKVARPVYSTVCFSKIEEAEKIIESLLVSKK